MAATWLASTEERLRPLPSHQDVQYRLSGTGNRPSTQGAWSDTHTPSSDRKTTPVSSYVGVLYVAPANPPSQPNASTTAPGISAAAIASRVQAGGAALANGDVLGESGVGDPVLDDSEDLDSAGSEIATSDDSLGKAVTVAVTVTAGRPLSALHPPTNPAISAHATTRRIVCDIAPRSTMA